MAFHSRPRGVDGSDTDGIGGRRCTTEDERKEAADGALRRCVEFEGMLLTVTDRDEVAEVVEGGGLRLLGSESYVVVEAGTATREHFVDVQGDREAMVLLVSVREDERRIVSIRRFS